MSDKYAAVNDDHYVAARRLVMHEVAEYEIAQEDNLTVLGYCIHGVDLDREFCSKGCRV